MEIIPNWRCLAEQIGTGRSFLQTWLLNWALWRLADGVLIGWLWHCGDLRNFCEPVDGYFKREFVRIICWSSLRSSTNSLHGPFFDGWVKQKRSLCNCHQWWEVAWRQHVVLFSAVFYFGNCDNLMNGIFEVGWKQGKLALTFQLPWDS
jgi:hypothetical protein